MVNKKYKNILLIFLITVFILIFNFVIKKQIFIYAESIMSSFMIVVLFLSILFFGFQKDKNNAIKSSLFYITLKILVIYFIVIFLAGLYFGYSKIVFSLKLESIVNNLFNPLISLIILEIFRYVIIYSNKNNKKIMVIYSILIGLIELSISTRYLPLNDFKTIYKSVVDFILPVAIKQLAFGYLCYYGGMKPTIIYRIVMTLYMYVVPIHPNLDSSIICMLNILLPVLVYVKSKDFIYEENREKVLIVKKKFNVEYLMTCCICLFLVMFASGVLPIGITAIASNSMYPTFSKGSGVLTVKVKEDKIEKGDIITFLKDNRKVIHRVVDIENDNGIIRYITKGDANTSVDDVYIKYEDIQNKIILSIPLIGYPSVIFNEIFS